MRMVFVLVCKMEGASLARRYAQIAGKGIARYRWLTYTLILKTIDVKIPKHIYVGLKNIYVSVE